MAAGPDGPADDAPLNHESEPSTDPEPSAWPVLVTGAGGFVGGHVARQLARAGHPVRGLSRSRPVILEDDPDIDWMLGDVRDQAVLRKAVQGMRGVVHAAGWVSLGSDRRGISDEVNVVATRNLLNESRRAGATRFVYTSTLHTLAAGTAASPADESSPWNLECVDSPYCRSKRRAEDAVRQASGGGFETVVLCPGMVLGPRDPKPTSTRLLLALARRKIAVVPRGGIPVIDVNVLSLAHRRALTSGRPGARYAVVGPYVSYPDLARLVGEVAGRPRVVLTAPDLARGPLMLLARSVERLALETEFSAATVAGAFLPLHVSGHRADTCFRLEHPTPLETIRAALATGLDPPSGRPPDP
jgi:dihydroflavonol-4-reductase